MKNIFHRFSGKLLLVTCFAISPLFSFSGTGDTIHVQGFNNFLHQNCNTGNASFLFPSDAMSFYKIMLRYELSCPPPAGCDIYDRIATLKVRDKTGVMDSTLALAPSFTVGGNSPDSLAYMTDTSWKYSYDTVAQEIDSMPLSTIQVFLYNDVQDPFLVTDTLVVWPAYYHQYTFNSNGVATDSVYVNPDAVLVQSFDSVYTVFEVIETYEIARAITPYGEGVVLWFDVSDYRTILHDSVTLNSVVCGYSNGWYVTTDFYFIEGVPPLRPFKLTNLWNGTFPYGNTSNPIESHLQPIKLQVDPQSVFEKIRLITTGHGFGCFPNQNVAEFYDVTHSLLLNNTSRPQRLWRIDCGRNPLYPQGAPGYTSTWFYKRANWCPGSFVTPHDYNATPYVSADTLVVDYNMVNYTVTNVPSGAYAPEYFIQSHAIFYDSMAYQNNAALLEIRRPSGAFEHNRSNPACAAYGPIVLIKNYGAANLTSLNIHYGIDGSYTNNFAWTGSLAFGDTVSVQLPSVSYGAGSHTFNAYVENPNGNADEFVYDDTLRAGFRATDIYNTNYIVITIKTDNDPNETSWRVRNDQGVVLFSRLNYPAAQTVYSDTVFLSDGCYNVTVSDAFGDGICCYNPQPPNNGYLRIYQGSSTTPLINSGDYGDFYSLNFTLDFNTGINDLMSEHQLHLYPNPANDHLLLNTNFESGQIMVSLMDLSGRSVTGRKVLSVVGHSARLELPSLPSGLYFVRVEKEDRIIMKKLLIERQ